MLVKSGLQKGYVFSLFTGSRYMQRSLSRQFITFGDLSLVCEFFAF